MRILPFMALASLVGSLSPCSNNRSNHYRTFANHNFFPRAQYWG